MPEQAALRRLATVAALVAAVAGAGGCGDSVERGGPLQGLPTEQEAGIVVGDAGRSPTWHFGSFTVCVKDDGPVSIERIDALEIGGVEVVSIGAKEASRDLAGAWPGPYSDAYEPAVGFEVAASCSTDQRVELVVELAQTGPKSSAVDGFTIRYSRGGQEYEVGYAVQILLCQGTDTSADEEVLADCATSADS